MFQFTQLLSRNVQQRAQQTALIFGETRYNFFELRHRVARLAGALRRLGMGENEPVAMLSLNSARYIEYLFAVPWGGGVLNPVNTRWSAEEIAYSLEDSDTKILLVDEHFAPLVEDIKRLSSTLETVVFAGAGEAPGDLADYERLIAEAEAVDDADRGNDDLLGIFYTGGTTGFPKGVMLSHTNFLSSGVCLANMIDLPEGGSYLHAAPMFHLADLCFGTVSMMRGCTQVVVPGFEAGAVSKAIADSSVSDTLLVPTMVQMLLDSPDFSASELASLERIYYGASPMPQATIEKAMRRLPHVSFAQAYGMTELGPLATISPPENHGAEGIRNGLIRSAGRAGPLQAIRIVDAANVDVATGEVGEVIVRGPNVMQGYWNKPEQTAEAIVDGWMHTGDMGRLDEDGWLYIVDRSKDMIISGGENVYSAEVENAIAQHPDVSQVAVIAVPCAEWGESVHAVIVPSPGAEPALTDIRDFCRQSIAGYKCPRSLELVEAMPLSGAGKILKNKLREPHWKGMEQGVS